MTPQFRITVTLDEALFKEIVEMAIKDNRKVASMAAILLYRQVREVNRKKKLPLSDASKDNNPV